MKRSIALWVSLQSSSCPCLSQLVVLIPVNVNVLLLFTHSRTFTRTYKQSTCAAIRSFSLFPLPPSASQELPINLFIHQFVQVSHTIWTLYLCLFTNQLMSSVQSTLFNIPFPFLFLLVTYLPNSLEDATEDVAAALQYSLVPFTGSGCASVLNTHCSKGNTSSSENNRYRY